MTIISKYNGKCKQCGGFIRKGDQIDWEKGEGIRHTTCPGTVPLRPQGTVPVPPVPKPPAATFRPAPKPGRQRTYPPKIAAQIIPAGTPGPYHGKFRRVEQFLHEAEAVVGSAALDAEHAAIVAPCSRRLQPAKESAAAPGRRTTVTLHMLCPTRTA